MTVEEAIKTLDSVIPEPDNRMVDLEHLQIARAYSTLRHVIMTIELIRQEQKGGKKE